MAGFGSMGVVGDSKPHTAEFTTYLTDAQENDVTITEAEEDALAKFEAGNEQFKHGSAVIRLAILNNLATTMNDPVLQAAAAKTAARLESIRSGENPLFHYKKKKAA